MSEINSQRQGCVDVFNAFLVNNATYDGLFDIPRIIPTQYIPNKVIAFSKALSCNDYNQWIHFYEDDSKFERIWRQPKRYLNLLKRFNGVILPDFSLYRDMPFALQVSNIYRSRAIGHWLQNNGVKVIPNIRFGDKRTYRICCAGIAKHCVISVGSHGNIKHKTDREIFLNGLDNVIKTLEPTALIVYGSAPDKYFKKYKDNGLKIIQFDSSFSISHKEVV